LLFFDAAASLAYDQKDIPRSLRDFPLRYHAHLPGNLPEDGARAAALCHALLRKVDFLSPVGAVLHPPRTGSGAAARLRAFVREWRALGRDPSLLLLENTRDNDLLDIAAVAEEFDLRVCLDMGHVLRYGQTGLVEHAALMRRVGILHVNAPGKGGEHCSLSQMEGVHVPAARRMCRLVPPTAVVMVELFDWNMIEESLPVLRGWL
jgi:sugar phosphate isomerase/epimerase